MFRVLFCALLCISSFLCAEVQQTLSIIKPDAVASNKIGDVISHLEKGGLKVVAMKMVKLTPQQAAQFYQVHQGKPFFNELVDFVSSGPVVVMVLRGENAIARNREIMEATDPRKAAPGTIRADIATSVTQNAVHGSDAPETAAIEIAFFFSPQEIYQR